MPWGSFVHLFVLSFFHLSIRSLFPSFVGIFVHSLFPSFVHSIIRSFVRSFDQSFIRAFICSFDSSFICSFYYFPVVHSIICSSFLSPVHLFIYESINSFHSFFTSFFLSFLLSRFICQTESSLSANYSGRVPRPLNALGVRGTGCVVRLTRRWPSSCRSSCNDR